LPSIVLLVIFAQTVAYEWPSTAPQDERTRQGRERTGIGKEGHDARRELAHIPHLVAPPNDRPKLACEPNASRSPCSTTWARLARGGSAPPSTRNRAKARAQPVKVFGTGRDLRRPRGVQAQTPLFQATRDSELAAPFRLSLAWRPPSFFYDCSRLCPLAARCLRQSGDASERPLVILPTSALAHQLASQTVSQRTERVRLLSPHVLYLKRRVLAPR
jgi:hypothetical protein